MTIFRSEIRAFGITIKSFQQALCCLGNLSVKRRWIELANCPKRVHRGARLGLGDSVPSDFSNTPCSVMSMSKGGSVPQLRWSSVSRAASDRTDAAIAKPETPFVRVDELGDQFPGMPGAPFAWTKSRLRARDRLAAPSSPSRQRQMPKKRTRAGSPMRGKISLIARFNSLQGLKNSLFECVGNWLVSH